MSSLCVFNLVHETSLVQKALDEFWTEWSEVSTVVSIGQRESREPQPRETRLLDAIYDCFPFLFYPDFPSVPLPALRILARAGRFYAYHAFISDSIMDTKSLQRADVVLRASLVQAEALHLLHQLFPAESPFWLQFKRCQHTYLNALRLELQWRQLPCVDFDLSTAEHIASGKAALTSAAIAALALLSGADECQKALNESLKLAHIGLQFYDDLRDWKEDLLEGQPSLLLAELCREMGWKTLPATIEERTASIRRLKLCLYQSGIAQAAAARAAEYFVQAQSALEPLPPPASAPGQLTWRHFLHNCYRSTVELEHDLRRMAATCTRQAAPSQGEVNTVDRMLERAVMYLVNQQGRDGEWGDFLFSIGHSTDWISGYVGQSLLPFPSLRPQLEQAVRWLLSTCVEGGWGYNTRAPRDADSTSNCGLFLLGMINKAGLCSQLLEPTRAALRASSARLRRYQHKNGGFSTYIAEDGQNGYYIVGDCWLEPHLEITATCARYFFTAAGRVTANVTNALKVLLEQQIDEGTWPAYWYDGPFYGTVQTLRLTAEAVSAGWSDPRLDHILCRTLRFMLQTQQETGGWALRVGAQAEAQAVSTALALHALVLCLDILTQLKPWAQDGVKHLGEVGDQISQCITPLRRGLAWLSQHQTDDGSWLPAYILRVPEPKCANPWLSEFPYASRADFNHVVCDQQRLFSGATVVQMLTTLQGRSDLLARLGLGIKRVV